jgi:diadenosine tetraphosphatase ApaH/serine/threonine PP2A family protein phosphatase
VICNVGAVGYPRDGDWRACYVLFDGEVIWFRRVEYDVETTIRKIDAIPMLANHFGDGLREGRVCVGSKRPNQAAAADRPGL